jgi:hypothetical protein
MAILVYRAQCLCILILLPQDAFLSSIIWLFLFQRPYCYHRDNKSEATTSKNHEEWWARIHGALWDVRADDGRTRLVPYRLLWLMGFYWSFIGATGPASRSNRPTPQQQANKKATPYYVMADMWLVVILGIWHKQNKGRAKNTKVRAWC